MRVTENPEIGVFRKCSMHRPALFDGVCFARRSHRFTEVKAFPEVPSLAPLVSSCAIYQSDGDEGERYSAANYPSCIFGTISTLFIAHDTGCKI